MRHTHFSMRVFLVLLFLTITLCLDAQETSYITVDEQRFGTDTTHKLVVWQPEEQHLDGLKYKNVDSILFGNISFLSNAFDLSNMYNAVPILNEKDAYKLYPTPFTLLKILSKDSIPDEPKMMAQISMAFTDTVLTRHIGIELRGNSALRYPKKSYDLEFRENEVSHNSVDVKIGDMRNDDDWILNSIYNEPLRLRSYFSNNLWLEVRNSSKENTKTPGQAGIKARYVEVFLNGRYQGIYLISEQVDRKLLKLEKFENSLVRGELFKAGSYLEGCIFKGAPPFNNNFPHWAGFEMEYPYQDYTSHWDDLAGFVSLVSEAEDAKFNAKIEERLDLDNAVDYFLFVNLLRATDNMGKNYFLARQDAGTPYYFIPWDLDGVLGSIQDGKRIPTTNDILSNGLFDRLWKNNPANYRKKVRERWLELRLDVFSEWKLMAKITDTYNMLDSLGIYEREELVWKTQTNHEEELQYIRSWLTNRLEFLDMYFGKE